MYIIDKFMQIADEDFKILTFHFKTALKGTPLLKLHHFNNYLKFYVYDYEYNIEKKVKDADQREIFKKKKFFL